MAKILVVDDSPFIVRQISQFLEKGGHEIVGTAIDGIQAIEKFKELKPDVVTLDITMPKMDGIEALEKILEIDMSAKVIMVSALGKEDMIKKAFLKGAKNYIVKPLDKKKVLDRVESVFKDLRS